MPLATSHLIVLDTFSTSRWPDFVVYSNTSNAKTPASDIVKRESLYFSSNLESSNVILRFNESEKSTTNIVTRKPL